MKTKIFFIICFMLILNTKINSQNYKTYKSKFYVGGLIYCKYNYNFNNDGAMERYIEVTNTQNFNGKNYISCRGCCYSNKYKIFEIEFEDSITNKHFTLTIREIDNENCILIFQDETKNIEKMEVYLAKEIKQ